MPYLDLHNKSRLANVDTQILMAELKGPGDLNYLFCKLALRYLAVKGESYQTYNDIHGALHCASQELYIRKTLPYEEIKTDTNGDIF